MARCPIISKCTAKVDLEKYNNVCTNLTEDAYKKCDTYKAFASQQKTPLEWDKLFTAM